MTNKAGYSSFNGLGRVAMVCGVPLMPLLAVSCASMLLGLVIAVLAGPGGLLFAGLGLPVLLYFKTVSENDSHALRVQWNELKCFLRRRNTKNYGGTYTLSPVRYGRKFDAYKRSFK